MMIKNARRVSRRFGTLAEARTGLARATLLFGSIAAALILIVVPDSIRHERAEQSAAVMIDDTVTGSLPQPGRALAERLDPSDAGPCLMFPDGTQRGACR